MDIEGERILNETDQNELISNKSLAGDSTDDANFLVPSNHKDDNLFDDLNPDDTNSHHLKIPTIALNHHHVSTANPTNLTSPIKLTLPSKPLVASTAVGVFPEDLKDETSNNNPEILELFKILSENFEYVSGGDLKWCKNEGLNHSGQQSNKRMNVVFYPVHKEDEMDKFLSEELIKQGLTEAVLKIPKNFKWLSKGKYQFGTKRIQLGFQGTPKKLIVKVTGGGSIPFFDFVSKYGEVEEKKISVKK